MWSRPYVAMFALTRLIHMTFWYTVVPNVHTGTVVVGGPAKHHAPKALSGISVVITTRSRHWYHWHAPVTR